MSNSDKSWNEILSANSNLDIWVSRWKQRDVEKELHISLSRGAVFPPFILQKINASQLSKIQDEYVQKVKTYLHLIDVELSDLFTCDLQVFTRNPQLLLDDALKTIMNNVIAQEGSESYIRFTILEFLTAIKGLVTECQELLLHTRTQLYQTSFTCLVRDLARLCRLIPDCSLASDKRTQSVWDNFRGTKCAISEPDMRLRKSTPEDVRIFDKCTKSEGLVVSVVQVKLPSRKASVQKRVLHKMVPNTSSSPSESTSSDDSSPDPLQHRRKRVNYHSDSDFSFIPNSQRVFGQHAGELLLDLNDCLKDTDCEIVRMPGMIINGSKVIFTLLEMQYKHLKKLRENKDLDEEDKAVLYYTVPYSILRRDDRNVILDFFMRFHNMVGYGHTETVIKTEETTIEGSVEAVESELSEITELIPGTRQKRKPENEVADQNAKKIKQEH